MSEENSYLYINSKLGPNKLLLESFTGSEGISRLFSFNLELLSKKEKEPIHFEKILGSEISFGVNGSEPGDPARCIHGIVTAFTRLSDTPYFSRYRPQTLAHYQETELPDFSEHRRPRHSREAS